jgi:hypothetical protein
LSRRAWQSVIKKTLCRTIRHSHIPLTVMIPASLKLTFMCMTLSLTSFLMTPRHQPSAEPLRWGSNASTREGSLVRVAVDHLLIPRHPPRRVLHPLVQLINLVRIHQSVSRRLVPHRAHPPEVHMVKRLRLRAPFRPPDLRTKVEVDHLLIPRHTPRRVPLHLLEQLITLARMHQSVPRRLVPHRARPPEVHMVKRLRLRAPFHPPDLRTKVEVDHLLIPRHPPRRVPLHLLGQLFKVARIHQSVPQCLVPHRARPPDLRMLRRRRVLHLLFLPHHKIEPIPRVQPLAAVLVLVRALLLAPISVLDRMHFPVLHLALLQVPDPVL